MCESLSKSYKPNNSVVIYKFDSPIHNHFNKTYTKRYIWSRSRSTGGYMVWNGPRYKYPYTNLIWLDNSYRSLASYPRFNYTLQAYQVLSYFLAAWYTCFFLNEHISNWFIIYGSLYKHMYVCVCTAHASLMTHSYKCQI